MSLLGLPTDQKTRAPASSTALNCSSPLQISAGEAGKTLREGSSATRRKCWSKNPRFPREAQGNAFGNESAARCCQGLLFLPERHRATPERSFLGQEGWLSYSVTSQGHWQRKIHEKQTDKKEKERIRNTLAARPELGWGFCGNHNTHFPWVFRLAVALLSEQRPCRSNAGWCLPAKARSGPC